MVDYKFVSGQVIITKLSRDFGIKPTDWMADSVEWVAGAAQIIGCNTNIVIAKPIETYIEDYKAKMPCNAEVLIGVTYNRRRLPCRSGQNPEDTRYLGHLPYCVDHYYTKNGNYINTSFKEGKVRFHFLSVPLDEEGFPCIVDREKNKNAITWYLMMMLMGKGYTHPIFDYSAAETRWNKYYPQAQNDIKMPSVERMQAFQENHVELVPNLSRYDNYFNERY